MTRITEDFSETFFIPFIKNMCETLWFDNADTKCLVERVDFQM